MNLWPLCAFIWFNNIEKMLLQMTSGFLQLESALLNDNVNQFKVGLESDKGYFILKVKTMTVMSHFFCPQ
jgi:hypothetical protein